MKSQKNTRFYLRTCLFQISQGSNFFLLKILTHIGKERKP